MLAYTLGGQQLKIEWVGSVLGGAELSARPAIPVQRPATESGS
jgi:hypothetical protein